MKTDLQNNNMSLTKTTAAQNEVTLSYHSVGRLYFLAVVFVGAIEMLKNINVFGDLRPISHHKTSRSSGSCP